MGKIEDLENQIRILKNENRELTEKYSTLKNQNSKKVSSNSKNDDINALFSADIIELFNLMPQPVVVTDIETGRFIFCNSIFEKLTGYTKKEVIGKTTLSLNFYSKETRKKLIDELKKKGYINNYPITFFHKNKKVSHTLMFSKRIKPEQDFLVSIIIDITELQNTKQELQESEDFYKAIADNSLDAIFIMSKSGKIKFVNKQHTAIFGRTENEVLGHYFYEFLPKKYISQYLMALKSGFLNKEIRNFNSFIYHKNGRVVPVEISGKIIKFKGKTIAIGNARDLTQRQEAEKALEKSDEKYKIITQQSVDTIFIVNKAGRILFLSKTQGKHFGWEAEEMTGRNFLEIVPEKEKTFFKSKLKEVIHGKELDFESVIYHKEGRLVPIEIKSKRYDHNGIKAALGVLRDISERKIAEKEKENHLLESLKTKNFLRELIDSTNDLIFAKDMAGNYVFANKAYCMLFGIDTQSIKTRTDTDLRKLLPDTGGKHNVLTLQEIGATLKERDKYQSLYNPIKMPDGSEKVFRLHKVNIRKNNKIEYSIFFANDITKMMRTERELTRLTLNLEKLVVEKSEKLITSEENFKKLFEKSSEIKIIFRRNGKIIQVNDRAETVIKLSREVLLKQNIKKIWDADIISNFDKISLDFNDELYHTFETTVFTSENVKIPYEISLIPVKYFGERVILATGRDISVRKEMNKIILKAIIETEEKERKRFAQEIHDGLGAYLSSIKMYIDIISDGRVTDEKLPDIFMKIQNLITDAAESAKEISNNINPHILINLGLEKSIQIIISKFTSEAGIEPDIFIQTNDIILDDNFASSIYRVITELLNNTIKHAAANKINLSLIINSSSLVLNYSDNGKGFDVNQMKNSPRGNGLINIQNRVKSLNGKAEIFSKPGEGTKYSITIGIEDFIK